MSEHMLDDETEESGADTCAICLARIAADEAFLDRCYHRFHFQVRQQTGRAFCLFQHIICCVTAVPLALDRHPRCTSCRGRPIVLLPPVQSSILLDSVWATWDDLQVSEL